MSQLFTIPQRKAYVQMLERYQARVESGSRIADYSARQEERRLMGERFGVPAAQKRVDALGHKVECEIERRDEAYAEKKRRELKDVAVAMSEVWGCSDVEAAKKIVRPFLGAEFTAE